MKLTRKTPVGAQTSTTIDRLSRRAFRTPVLIDRPQGRVLAEPHERPAQGPRVRALRARIGLGRRMGYRLTTGRRAPGRVGPVLGWLR